MREYLTVFLVAAAVTYLLTVIAREIAIRTGATAAVRDRDVHDEPVPYLGGLAMLGGLVAAYVVARQLPFLSTSNEDVFHSAKVVLIAGGIICLVGVFDDIFELDALTKFGGQLLAAGFLVWQGIQLTFFIKPDGGQFSLQTTQAALLTVFIIVSAVNAVNFVDGLDGLASGVVGIGAAAFFLFCYQLSYLNKVTLATTGALLSAAVAGVCIGFLPHNVNPARVFMGDSGSMLLGLTLSAAEITLTRQFPADAINRGAMGTNVNWLIMLLPLALPLSIMLLPLADLVLAVVRRTRAGRSPFAPDKQHLHHRMLEIGHSHRRAVFILWLWAALLAFGTVVISLYTGPLMWWSLLGALVLTIAATFILPVVHRPHLHAPVEAGTDPNDPESAGLQR